MQHCKKNKQKGFTVQEMLFVVLISIVLLAVSIVGIVTYMHRLQITTLDNAAKEIFMAAQNRAILLHNGNRLERYVIRTDGSNRIDHVDVDTGSGETTQITAYYIHSSEQNIMQKLLPQETIESTLWQGDFYVIYEPESGSVVDVFFGDETLPIESDFPNFYKQWRVASRDVRMEQSPMIGYYGGDPSESATAISLRTPIINIYNEDTLRAEVTYWLPRTLVMIQEDKNVKLDVTLQYQGQEITLKQTDAQDTLEPGVAYFAYTYTWILDSLEEDEVQFKELFPQSAGALQYGKDFTIYADVKYSGELHINGANKTAQDNSLFATGSDGETAYIAYLRHLQNLDKAYSNVDEKVYAEQKADIAEKETYNFQPIHNAQLQSYDGKAFSIYGLHIKEQKESAAGLFGVLEGTQNQNKQLRNIRLVDTTISAQNGPTGVLMGMGQYVDITNCQVYWENRSEQSTNLRDILGDSENGINYQVISDGVIGGLVGKLTNANVQGCSASTLMQGNAAVGGLIGQSSGVTVKNAYAASYLKGKTVAGLIGNVQGNTKISGSYAVGFMDSDTQVAAKAAGLSLGAGNTQVDNSYSAMLFGVGNQLKNYPLCEKGTYQNTYYVASDPFNLQPGNEALAKPYSDLTDPAKWDTLFAPKTFVPKSTAKSHPYNLQTTLELTTFVYPGIASLEHWGDWGAQFRDSSLVYYERYADNTYGFSGGGKNYLSNDKVIIEDGYAMAYQSKKSISDIHAVLDVTYLADGKTKKERIAYGKDQSGVIYEVANVPEAANGGHYYLLTLPGSVVNTNYAAKDFYQKIQINNVEDQIEEVYYYNPHFANAILPYEEGLDLENLTEQKQVQVRTPRHLYMLSRLDTYYTSNHQYRFLQEQDLDYGVYIGYDLFTGQWQQTPIGIDATNPFRGSYYGNSYLIKGVRSTATDEKGKNYQYIGLFGYNTAVLRDIVYEMYQEAAYTVTQSGSSAKTLYAGGLVGYNGGTVRNCAIFDAKFHANCYMYSTVYMGALVACNEGNILNSSAEVAHVSANTNLSNAYIGGFVGHNMAGGRIDQSYAVGKVTASRARYGDVYACGFAGQNDATIQRSYAAVSLLVEGEGERYGFSPDTSTNCVYLNEGNFTYRNQHYAAQYPDPAAKPVTWAQLRGQEENDAVYGLGMAGDTIAFQSTKKYPYPGTVKNRENNPMHYGQWPDHMDLGTMGVYYWEKLSNANAEPSYHFSVLSTDGEQILERSTLSTVHGDGATVTEYGYGYFHRADTQKPALLSKDMYWDNGLFTPKEEWSNTEINQALSDLMSGQYHYYSYNTWQAEKNQGLHLIMAEQNQAKMEPPVATWTLMQGTSRMEVKLNPFFADAMSYETEHLPGTEENFYQVRSIEQLQFINWNSATKNTQTVLVKENAVQFPFLSYGIDRNLVQRDYHWKQTHDLDGKKKIYTPIAEFYDPDWGVNGGILSGWFGGNYDGNDYIIADVNIHGQTSSCVGLFGAVFNGTLKNIVLHSTDGTATVMGSDSGTSQWYAIGGLAGLTGSTEGSAVTNCAVTGYTVQDTHQATKKGGWGGTGLGGLIGVCDMDMKGCTAVTNIKLDSRDNDNVRMGGLVGSCQGSISSSYAGGSITVAKTSSVFPKRGIYGGGIVGGIYMKPLKVGNRSDITVGRPGQKLQNTLNNCYSYVVLPNAASNQYIKGLYVVGGSGELNQDREHDDPGHYNSDHGWSNYNNNFYLAAEVLKNNGGTISRIKTDIDKEEVVGMTYSQMSDSTDSQGLLHRLNANGGGFATVTTQTVEGESIDGRYSFGSDSSLLGKNYPFPTILTQSSDLAPNGRANVHYGDWPLAGIRRTYGALPVNLDVFADYKEAEHHAVWEETLTLSMVEAGGQWNVSSQNAEVADAVLLAGDTENNRILKVTAKSAGSTIILVSYEINGKVYELPIEVNVTAYLRLVAKGSSPILVFTDELMPTIQTSAVPSANIPLELHDKNDKKLPEGLQVQLLNCNVEFDPTYFSQATIQQENGLMLQATSKTKTGATQMTAQFDFTYLGKEYHTTSALLFQIAKPEVTLPKMEFIFEKDVKQEQTKQYDGKDDFVLQVNGQPQPISDVRMVGFEEVVPEFKETIWVEWAKNADGTAKTDTVAITAYPQKLYPASAMVKLQFRFVCDGNTYTTWQNLPIEVKQKAEEAQS